MKANEPECTRLLLLHEGGNDDDPRDPGGRTSRGIIQREWNVYRQSHPGLPSDVWRAPQSAVLDIYDTKYWDALACDSIPSGVDYAVFDYGVNSGIGRSAKVLQRLVSVSDDGVVGGSTIEAVKARKPEVLVNAICDERLRFLQSLRTWPTFGNGWGRRVREVRASSLAIATARIVPRPSVPVPGKGQVTPPSKGPAWGWGGGGIAGIAATLRDWVVAHPYEAAALGIISIGAVAFIAHYGIKAWHDKTFTQRQEAPTPGLIAVPAM